MKKIQACLIIFVLIISVSCGKRSGNQKVSVQSFSPNSCWLYHEYVYKVDFRDPSLEPFFFVRAEDGTFSPSDADSPGNNITGNGFIIDQAGTCVITDKMAMPWMLSTEEQQPLRDLIDEWLSMKTDPYLNKEYSITGQTVALFAVLKDPEEFIEYALNSDFPVNNGYVLVYPQQKMQMKGLGTGFALSETEPAANEYFFQVLKTTFDESNSENPMAITSIDSITVKKTNDGYLDDVTVQKGDKFFYEGSVVFDASGSLVGNLHYENDRWKLVTFQSFSPNPPAYGTGEENQVWEYDLAGKNWVKK